MFMCDKRFCFKVVNILTLSTLSQISFDFLIVLRESYEVISDSPKCGTDWQDFITKICF